MPRSRVLAFVIKEFEEVLPPVVASMFFKRPVGEH
jgi:hypothetical protein